MHGNLLNKGKLKLFNTANSDLAARILILENNVYKVTYYEIISGASGTLTVPTAATINANEFSGANCILSEIDINNKPTWVSPKTAGGTVVTATLNTGTGAWVKSGVTVSANVALIYSINIAAKDYSNLTNFYIIDETVIGDFSYVLNNTTTGTVSSSLLANAMSDETGSGSLVFGTQPTFTQWITVPRVYGGTGVSDGIDFYSTSGNGTSSAVAHRFLGGNNGATTILTMLNDGTIRIPNNRVIQGTDSGGTNRALISWSGGDNITINGRPGTTDIVLNPTSGGVGLYVKSGGDGGIGVASPSARWHIIKTTEQLRVGYDTSNYYSTTVGSTGNTIFSLNAATSGASVSFSFNIPTNTGQTASTEISNFKVNGASKTWAAGAITTQRWNYFTANTAAFASASTITNSYGLYVEAATAGTNATITNNWALGTNGNIWIDSSSASIYLGNITPSSSNYALSYTAANELSVNAISTMRLRVGGTIYGTLTATSLSLGNYLTLGNVGSDIKLYMQRTGGKNTRLETTTASTRLYNESDTLMMWTAYNNGSFAPGLTSALATNATDGFLYVPSCAGIPTGVPTAITGKIPIVADSTNNKLYIYSGGAWVALN